MKIIFDSIYVLNLKNGFSCKMNSLDAILYLGFKISKNDTFFIKEKNDRIKMLKNYIMFPGLFLG